MRCPDCGSGRWSTLHKDAVDPARDRFVCQECHKEFTRYQPRKDDTTFIKDADMRFVEVNGEQVPVHRGFREFLLEMKHWRDHFHAWTQRPLTATRANRADYNALRDALATLVSNNRADFGSIASDPMAHVKVLKSGD